MNHSTSINLCQAFLNFRFILGKNFNASSLEENPKYIYGGGVYGSKIVPCKIQGHRIRGREPKMFRSQNAAFKIRKF